jgi:hypothetical protein
MKVIAIAAKMDIVVSGFRALKWHNLELGPL